MSVILESARNLEKSHEGQYIRLDGWYKLIDSPACRVHFYRLHRVWSDGINVRKYGTNPNSRPAFLPLSKLNQRVEVLTVGEFIKLPEK